MATPSSFSCVCSVPWVSYVSRFLCVVLTESHNLHTCQCWRSRSVDWVQTDAGYMATLQASRTFQSPDCVEAMAEVYGLVDGLDALQVSTPLLPFN